jgi:hypothetical protein
MSLFMVSIDFVYPTQKTAGVYLGLVTTTPSIVCHSYKSFSECITNKYSKQLCGIHATVVYMI